MLPQIVNLTVSGNGFSEIRNETQKRILTILLRNKGLKARQIARRLKSKYSTIHTELQRMKEAKQIIKDTEKRYYPNPRYGEYLIHNGLKIIGMKDHKTAIIFQKRFTKIRKRVDVLEDMIDYLERSIKEMLGVGG